MNRKVAGEQPSGLGPPGAWRNLGALLIVSCFPILAADNAALSPWSRFITLRSAPGYKDNVTYSSQARDGSAFWLNGGDIFLLRASTNGPQLSLFLMGEDIRYFSGSVSDEQLALASAEISQRLGEDWKVSLTGVGSYNAGVFDASSTTTNRVVNIEAHSFAARPQVTRYLPGNTRLELRAEILRQYFKAPLDDYWEGGPRILFGWGFARASDASLSYGFRERAYDRRAPLSLAGFPLPGGLRMEQHEVDAQVSWTLDERKVWRLVSKAGYERNLDNGEGYFDYHRFTASEALRYRSRGLEVEGKVSVGHYKYDDQPAATGSMNARWRTMFGGGLSGRYELTERWSVYAEWLNEQNASNDPFEEYSANTLSMGVEVNF